MRIDITESGGAGANNPDTVKTTDTSTSGYGFVIDEDTMVSDSATNVPTQQSTKAYVDSQVAGGVTYKGGYDANTNIPDLDTTPSGVIKGDMYTVTAAGTFFTASVEVGDVIIAEIDSAAVEADWTIVQTNLVNAVLQADTDVSTWGFTLDEDNMASDSATKFATQQSIKAYVDSAGGGGLGYTAYFGGSWGTGGNTDFARVSTVAGGSVDGAAAEENNFVVPATGTITKVTWSKQNTGGTYTMKINYGASNTTFNCTSGAVTGVNTVSLAVTEGDIITLQQNGTADSIGDAGFCLYIS
jgi:hypothetical protein